jgi:Rho GDP-dissociation inhibitor
VLFTVDGLLMSLEVGVNSNTKSMGFDEKNKEEVSETAATTKTPPNEEEHNVDEPKSGGISRKMSERSLYGTDQEEEDDEETNERKIELGPQCTLKEQLEKDKVCFSFLFSTSLCFLIPVSFY